MFRSAFVLVAVLSLLQPAAGPIRLIVKADDMGAAQAVDTA